MEAKNPGFLKIISQCNLDNHCHWQYLSVYIKNTVKLNQLEPHFSKKKKNCY